jgi:hypothetical protein
MAEKAPIFRDRYSDSRPFTEQMSWPAVCAALMSAATEGAAETMAGPSHSC